MSDVCVVMRKKDILKQLADAIPDDAIVIMPAWGLHGQMTGATQKNDPHWGVKFILDADILCEPKFVGAINALHFAPVTWMESEKAKRYINQHGFELADK
jgi:hypothetical protein